MSNTVVFSKQSSLLLQLFYSSTYLYKLYVYIRYFPLTAFNTSSNKFIMAY